MWVHVLRNAAIPIITHVMASLPALLIGAFLLERFFSIPGIGREVILAVERSDFPVIKAITVYVAVATMVFNLLADLMYKAVDPRVQLEDEARRALAMNIMPARLGAPRRHDVPGLWSLAWRACAPTDVGHGVARRGAVRRDDDRCRAPA